VYADHRVTFYCGCRYDADRRIDLASCGLQALTDLILGGKMNAGDVAYAVAALIDMIENALGDGDRQLH
jgi:hypothetical protein